MRTITFQIEWVANMLANMADKDKRVVVKPARPGLKGSATDVSTTTANPEFDGVPRGSTGRVSKLNISNPAIRLLACVEKTACPFAELAHFQTALRISKEPSPPFCPRNLAAKPLYS
jgi:hypothetical protein